MNSPLDFNYSGKIRPEALVGGIKLTCPTESGDGEGVHICVIIDTDPVNKRYLIKVSRTSRTDGRIPKDVTKYEPRWYSFDDLVATFDLVEHQNYIPLPSKLLQWTELTCPDTPDRFYTIIATIDNQYLLSTFPSPSICRFRPTTYEERITQRFTHEELVSRGFQVRKSRFPEVSGLVEYALDYFSPRSRETTHSS